MNKTFDVISPSLSAKLLASSTPDLIDILNNPEDWQEEVIEFARYELERRGVAAEEIESRKTALQASELQKNTLSNKRNLWVTAASIFAAITSIHALVALILVWFVLNLPETLGGWEGIKPNPLSLIDVFILFSCAVGMWYQRIFLARVLVFYQSIQIILLLFIYDKHSQFSILYSLVAFSLYAKALTCFNKQRKRNE
jgi:hypothetical protein